MIHTSEATVSRRYQPRPLMGHACAFDGFELTKWGRGGPANLVPKS